MKIRTIVPALVIPLLLLAWVWMSRVPASSLTASEIEAPKDHFISPAFTLATIDGTSLSLVDLKGNPIILNFWASWCPPCRAEMPAFQQAWLEYKDTDLEIITINATHQDSLSDIRNFIDQNQLQIPILLDINGSVSSSYQIHSLPTTFLISRDGTITKTLIGGPIPLALLRVYADQLLQEDIDAANY